jgi:hypothetical protein
MVSARLRTAVRLSQTDGPSIELATTHGLIDLHNFADFERLVYQTDGTLRLEWVPTQPGELRLGEQPVERAALVFIDVTRLEVLPRDLEMPHGEDRALDHFLVLEPAPSCRMRFVFRGGAQLDVVAGSVNLIVDLADQPPR